MESESILSPYPWLWLADKAEVEALGIVYLAPGRNRLNKVEDTRAVDWWLFDYWTTSAIASVVVQSIPVHVTAIKRGPTLDTTYLVGPAGRVTGCTASVEKWNSNRKLVVNGDEREKIRFVGRGKWNRISDTNDGHEEEAAEAERKTNNKLYLDRRTTNKSFKRKHLNSIEISELLLRLLQSNWWLAIDWCNKSSIPWINSNWIYYWNV